MPFSRISCSAMAVEDIARPTPPITAACQAKCVRYSNAPSTAAVINTAGAGAEDRTPQLPQLAGVQLQTDDEHQEHHAQLGEVQDLVDVANEAQSRGPMAMPAIR